MISRKNSTLLALALGLTGIGSTAQAVVCDLTTGGSTCTINSAKFNEGDFIVTSSGTGVFPAFVQVAGNNEVKSAYNTTVNNVLDNGAPNNFNHAIRLSDVTTVDGYYAFYLDINQNDNTNGRLLSLSDVQIFTSTVANQSVTTLAGGTLDLVGNLRYWMDQAEDSVVKLTYGLHPGSGRADMQLLVPIASFSGALGTDFVYLYSKFGDYTWGSPLGGTNNDGFEEWALDISGAQTCPPGFTGTPPDCTPPDEVPEPGTLALLGLGLLGLGFSRRAQS